MPLFMIQDSDRPMWLVAADWGVALAQWKALIASENDGDDAEPDGIQLVCPDDELLIYGRLPYSHDPLPRFELADLQAKGISVFDALPPGERQFEVLYEATKQYVERNGGSVSIIGGMQVQEWATDGPGVYRIAIKCTGKPPAFNPTEQTNGNN